MSPRSDRRTRHVMVGTDARDGTLAPLTGLAANRSSATGVRVADLLTLD